MAVKQNFALVRFAAMQKYPYFSTALMSLIPVPTKKGEEGMPSVMACDALWRVYYCEEWVESAPLKEVVAALIHEVNHLIRSHHARGERLDNTGLNMQLLNIAGDMEINPGLENLPDWVVYPKHAALPDGKLMEWYWDELKRSAKQVTLANPCGSGATGGGPKAYEKAEGDGENGTAPGISGVEQRAIREETAKAVKRAGDKAGQTLLEWANETLTTHVDWRAVLRARTLDGCAISRQDKSDYSFSEMSRRRFPRIILPGLRGYLPRITALVDTSGSMNERLLGECLAILHGISQQMGTDLTVHACDVHIHQTIRYTGHVPAGFLQGQGGTDMSYGILEALKRTPGTDVLVVLTDGYTGWCDRPRTKTVPVILTPDGLNSAPEWVKAQAVVIDERK